MNFLKNLLAATALSVGLAGTASAVTIFSEVGDAGDSTATANDASGIADLGGFTGSISLEPNRGPDFVDIFLFSMPVTGKFIATTGSMFDPMLIADPVLYLFNVDGYGVAMNDEGGGNGQALLARRLIAGLYYLAIAYAGVEPLDAAGNPIFDTFGSLAVLSGNPLASWLNAPFAVDPGTVGDYRIWTRVPDPGVLQLALLGLLGLGAFRRRAAV